MQTFSTILSKNPRHHTSHLSNKRNGTFFNGLIQPKLTINQPNDVYEQEADAVADSVMRMADKTSDPLFFQPVPVSISSIQRKCAACEEEDKVRMKSDALASGATTAPSSVDNAISSGGQPLDKSTKNFMESRMGYDFSNVKIHNDSSAHRSSKEINALAFTHGNHIVFGSGQYQPNTNSGKKLLAHELAHVVQQKAAEQSHFNDAAGIVQKKDGDTKCTQPASVEFIKPQTIAYPDFLTGTSSAGICALMKAFPEDQTLCPGSIKELVTLDKSASTCPETLVKGACSGDSVFSPGKKQKLCDVAMSATEFTDRHSIQVQTVSVLHDRKRNPKNLKSCKSVCNQKYFTVDTKNDLGDFQIVYELTKAKVDNKDVTNVKATKKKVKP
jgi:hypothetical protein